MGVEEDAQVVASLQEKLGGIPEGAPPQTDAPGETPEGDTSPPSRDAQTGRFIGKEEAVEQERLYAGRYKTPEELEAALYEKEQMIGRQSAEVAEARRALEQAQQQQPDMDLDWLTELAEDDPYQAAELAKQAQDATAYERVMAGWSQENPEAARLYHQNSMLEARLAQIEAQTQAALQPVQQQLGDQRLTQAFLNVAHRYPEVKDMPVEMAEAATASPALAYMLQYPGQEEQALESMYLLAKGRQWAESQQQPAQAQAQPDPQQALRDGYVASATSVQPADGPPQNADDEFRSMFQQLARDSIVSVSRGITRDPD